MIPFVDVLKKLRPDSSISFGPGAGLASVIWDNVPQGFVPPTQAEVDAAMAVIEYQEKRRSEYPPLADLADATVHRESGDPQPYADYIAACLAVKAKYPKP
jgi:hypothetical protein